MHNFIYVTKKEAAPHKHELISLINAVQKEVKKYFTFQFNFVGSSKRNMITCEKGGNIGYDFDVNIEPNDNAKKYTPSEIRMKIFEALRNNMKRFGYSKIENSTSVITIKAVDKKKHRIEHSCDFAIVFNCSDGQQQYIKYDKHKNDFYWVYRDKGYYIADKLQWIKQNGLSLKHREHYLYYKNRNNDTQKHSRTIFAESVNDLYNKYKNNP